MREKRGAAIPLGILVDAQAKAAGWPTPQREYRFHATRKWRFDYAWRFLWEPGVDVCPPQLRPGPGDGSIWWHPNTYGNEDDSKVVRGEVRVALEVQGGIWIGGKHGRGSGIIKDHEKMNAAQSLRWRVLQLTPSQVRKGELQTWLEKMR